MWSYFILKSITYNIRNGPLLRLADAKLTYSGLNLVLFRSCILWNDLPLVVDFGIKKKRKKWKIWETINWDKVFKNGPSTVFQKWYLIHSWVPCPNCSCVLWQWNNKMNKISIYVGTGNWLDIGIHYPRHNFFKGKFTRMSNWYHYSLLFPGVCFYQIYCDEWLFFINFCYLQYRCNIKLKLNQKIISKIKSLAAFAVRFLAFDYFMGTTRHRVATIPQWNSTVYLLAFP